MGKLGDFSNGQTVSNLSNLVWNANLISQFGFLNTKENLNQNCKHSLEI